LEHVTSTVTSKESDRIHGFFHVTL
jgi:hypothetical protein